jgi:hypothetical protein
MGFDINICLSLLLCPETGKPFYLHWDKTTHKITKNYSIPIIEIPKELCKYLEGRGHLFHAYTDYFNERDIFTTDVRQFLEHYPSWDRVIEHENYTDDYEGCWNEEDHTNFEKLLDFLTEQEVTFTITWSY